MKLQYITPQTEIIYIGINEKILMNHSEPEITSNIGANENSTFEDSDEDIIKTNLWDE